MILITGASGKTGQAIVRILASRGVRCRALVRRTEQVAILQAIGASEVQIGDLTMPNSLKQTLRGIDTIYHICPNMHPLEASIGKQMIDCAQANGVARFVYHSVLHPQTEEMPHHWNKLQVESLLFKSGLDYTILQPAAYMQNVLAYRKAMVEEGVYRIPYAAHTRISLIDLEEVAEVAANLLLDSTHTGAIYELAGPDAPSQTEIAQIAASIFKQDVRVSVLDRTQWKEQAQQNGLSAYAVETLLKMFEYYEHFGFLGNPKVAEMLLGRKLKSFKEWAAMHLST